MKNRLFALLPFLIALGLRLPVSLMAADETPATFIPPVPLSPTAPVPRPRIGLVLSGGGARGAAHVGVLKVLEELHIPVDFIVGTSMGSAVGGLYATGLSSNDLYTVFGSFDWQGAFSDAPPRNDLSFRRKQDDLTFLVDYRMGFRDGKVRFPLGAVEGQEFITELRRLGHITEVLPSFNDLPTPFRAVATDVIAGQSVVISSGDLALAMRASMAISPLFTPVQYQGRLLVDGGYLDNIPVDVARSMGCDRLIVVNIGTPLSKRKDIQSVFDVISQTGRIGGDTFDHQQLSHISSKDVLIQPDLDGYSFVDFKRIPEMMKRGEDATRQMSEALKSFSVPEAEYKKWREAREKRPPANPVIDGIAIRNGAKLADKFLLRMISQPIGKPLDAVTLQHDLAQINGLGYYDYVDYNIIQTDGKNILVIKAPRKSWGPGYLQFGLQLENDFEASSTYALAARYTQTDINSLGAELQTNAQIGTNSSFNAEFNQPLDYQVKLYRYGAPLFIAPRVSYNSSLYDLTNNGGSTQVLQQYRVKTPNVGFDLGHYISNFAQIRLGLDRSWNNADAVVGNGAPVSSVYWNDAAYSARLTVDTLDSPAFTREGVYSNVELRNAAAAIGSGRDNKSLDVQGWGFHSFGRNTFGVKGVYSTNLDTVTTTPRLFAMGGFLNLSGYSPQALYGTNRALSQVRYYYNLCTVARMPLYLGGAEEWGGVWNSRSEIALNSGSVATTGFVGLGTVFGPLYIGYSRASHNNFATTFYLGHLF